MNACYTTVTITFKNGVNCDNFETLFRDWLNQTISSKFYLDFQPIISIDDTIEFELHSTRLNNLEWQVDKCVEFIKVKYKDLVVEFSSSSYVATDTGSYYLTEEDFE